MLLIYKVRNFLKEISTFRFQYDLVTSLFDLTDINCVYKSRSTLEKKEEIVDELISLLEKSLELNVIRNKPAKLEIFETLDKLHFRKEVLDLLKNNIDLNKLKEAGTNLGRKSQSGFSGKDSITKGV